MILLAIGLLGPGNHSLISSVYLYPIYADFFLNCQFIQGAWITIYCLLWLLKSELNHEFDKDVFKMTTESSLWCYVTHSLFSFSFVTYFVVPYKDEISFLPALLLCFAFTETMCLVSYYIMDKLSKKKRD